MPCISDTVHGDWGAKLSPLEGSEAVVSHSGASQGIQLHTEPLPKELTSCPQLLTDAETQGQRDCEGLNLTLLLIVLSWLVAWCEDLKPHQDTASPPQDGNTTAAWQGLGRANAQAWMGFCLENPGHNLPPRPPSIRISSGIYVGMGVGGEGGAGVSNSLKQPPHHLSYTRASFL